MTTGEKLLNLTVEYKDSLEARSLGTGNPVGREPSVIADEYLTELKAALRD